MKRTKILLSAVAAVLVIILPLLMLIGAMFAIPPQYTSTFVGELDNKYDRLMSLDEPKVVVVGGSSVAFGLESELIEKYLGMPVVNFGLYAALGTKVMLDLSRSGIGEGDIVILAPELDKQTMSMYFNAQTTLQATDDKPLMLMHLRGDDIFATLGALFEHIGDKIEYFINGAPDPSGVYNGKNFNEYGDLEYERKENVMALTYDPNTMITLNESILSDDFMSYLNEYIADVRAVGADVYFSYCPMNELALAEGTSEDSLDAFEAVLSERIDCPIISHVEDYILGAGYFYDTNFHLNDTGSIYRTLRLIEDILLARDSSVLVREDYPNEPMLGNDMIVIPPSGGSEDNTEGDGKEDDFNEQLPGDGEAGDNGDADTPELLDPELVENTEYFNYEVLPGGNLKIVSLTELGKTQETLTIPVYAKLLGDTVRRAVTVLGEGALTGTVAHTLIIPEDSYLASMSNGCFDGAETLKALYIYLFDADSLNPPASFSGTHADFVIHAPEESGYTTSYYWSQVKQVEIILDLKVE